MLEIKNYKKAYDIPKKYLSSLVQSEIECWWAEPFSEYAICDECRWVYSIEDIYNSIDYYRKKIVEKIFICKCGCETSLLYPQNKYLDLLVEYIKWEVIASLLINNDKVEGFWVLTITSLNDLINNHIDNRPNSYDNEKVIKLLSQSIAHLDNSKEKSVIYSNQIYVSPFLRKSNISFELLKNITNLVNNKYRNLTLIWETKYESNFYPISRLLWYKDIVSDKYWNVLQYCDSIKQVKTFFDTYDSFNNKTLLKNMFKYKKEANLILQNNPNFLNRKFYN